MCNIINLSQGRKKKNDKEAEEKPFVKPGLEEGLGQNTAALQNSQLLGSRETSSTLSSQSSHSPLLSALASGSSEDMGGGVVEVEEVARLERRVRDLEGVEARVRVLEEERMELGGRLEEQEVKRREQDARRQEQDAREQEVRWGIA